jgi:hypothetical protein
VQLAEDGTEDREARKDAGWDQRVAADSNVQRAFVKLSVGWNCIDMERWRRTIARFIEAMLWVAMAGEDRDFVVAVLEPDCSVYNEALGATYT